MQEPIDYDRLLEQPVWGPDQEKLGSLDDLYFDDANGQATWGTMRSGLFANHVSFFPMAHVTQAEDGLHIPFSHDQLKAAPSADPEQQLSADDEAALTAYFAGLSPAPLGDGVTEPFIAGSEPLNEEAAALPPESVDPGVGTPEPAAGSESHELNPEGVNHEPLPQVPEVTQQQEPGEPVPEAAATSPSVDDTDRSRDNHSEALQPEDIHESEALTLERAATETSEPEPDREDAATDLHNYPADETKESDDDHEANREGSHHAS